ncbi:hypothetical protein HFN89_05880 [Rhizobium laguerreae]|nr:hypothetical protein [Rhizobium laguerreae]
MKLKVKFPVLFNSAVVPRYGEPKTVIALFDTQLEVEELDGASAPVVVRVGSDRRDFIHRDEFRHRNGLFYGKIPLEWQTLEDIVRYRHWRLALHRLAHQVADRAEDVLPKGVVAKILRDEDLRAEYPKLEKLAKSTKLADAGIAELETAAAEFHSWAAETVVAIDGDLWVECPEPMLSVDRFATYPAELVMDDLGKKDPISGRFHRASVGLTLYTMNQLDQAFLPKINAPAYRDTTTVEVLDPTVFQDEVPIGDIVAQLSELSTGRELSEEARYRLTDLVSNEADWSWDRVYDEVQYLLDTVFTQKHSFTRGLLEFERDRLDARPISIPSCSSRRHGP